jgi:hypothetical protein
MEGLEQSVVAAINAATPRYLQIWQRIEIEKKKERSRIDDDWRHDINSPECETESARQTDIQVRRVLEIFSVFGRYENAYVVGQSPEDYARYLDWTYARVEQEVIDPLCRFEPTEEARDLLRTRAHKQAQAKRQPWIEEAGKDYARHLIEAPFRQDWVIEKVRAVQNFANGAYCDPAVIGSQTKTERTLIWAQSLFDGIGETFLAVIRDGQGDSGAFAHALKRRYGRIVASYAQTMHSLDASEETHSEEFWVLLEMEMLSHSRQGFWCGKALEAEAALVKTSGASTLSQYPITNAGPAETQQPGTLNLHELGGFGPLPLERKKWLRAARTAFLEKQYKKDGDKDGIQITDRMIALKCEWAERSRITWWKACYDRLTEGDDIKIRNALKDPPTKEVWQKFSRKSRKSRH